MPAEPPEGRKVKSGPVGAVEATDRHERAKDYLSPAEVARLLDATKAGRHGVRDHRFSDSNHGRKAGSALAGSSALVRCREEISASTRITSLIGKRSTASLPQREPIDGPGC